MVLSHHRSSLVDDVEDADMDEFRATYKDFDPRIKRIVDMVPTARRWPLLVTGPLKTWSTPEKNVVLMGWVWANERRIRPYKITGTLRIL